MGARLTKLLALAALVLGVSASGGSAAGPAHAPILGVVPHAGAVQPFAPHALGARGMAPQNGPLLLQESPCALTSSPLPCWVMRTNTVHAVYWFPSGYVLDPAYRDGIDRYFKDVAHDSGLTSNVYSAATQYYDATGPISYRSSFAGSYVDTNPFPTNGCDDGHDPVCLTDQQIQAELQKVLGAKGWQPGPTTLFFVMTPDGVGSCVDSVTGQCTTTTYCAYHSGFVDSSDQPVLYANEPYAATIDGCSGVTGQGFPNGTAVDSTLNTISHEHNEAITDPWGDAWLALDGEENGDLCAWVFENPTGQSFNQAINGHQYDLQEEYSNDGSTCVQHYLGIPVSFGSPAVSGAAGVGRTLTATPGTWSQSPTSYAYQWQLCAANGTGCGNIAGATAATYALTTAAVGHRVRLEVSAHNAAGNSRFVPSAPTAAVVPLPASTGHPVLSGSAGVGRRLFTTTGSWNSTVTVAYEWLRCTADGAGCASIPGATSPAYRVASEDTSHRLEARVTATNAAGTAVALSNRSAVVVGTPPTSRKGPRISGRVRVGARLSGSPGSWDNSPTVYRFQWLRCNRRGGSCIAIKRATHPTYRLTSRDAGHRLRLRVIARNAAGGRKATSQATARVPGTQ